MKNFVIVILGFALILGTITYSGIFDLAFLKGNTLNSGQSKRKMANQYSMNITSQAFQANQSIPTKYTCDGENINPSLSFSDIPAGTKSLVLLMDDPDVPRNLKPDGVFDHWVIYNMDPTVTELLEGERPPGMLGLNGAGKPEYAGPCPPDREHRYFFKLYALDTMLQFHSDPTKTEVKEAMEGHVLEEAELLGLYNRQK